jgi:hypothetical protein
MVEASHGHILRNGIRIEEGTMGKLEDLLPPDGWCSLYYARIVWNGGTGAEYVFCSRERLFDAHGYRTPDDPMQKRLPF